MPHADTQLETQQTLLRLLKSQAALAESIGADGASLAFLDPRDFGIGDQYGFGPAAPGAPMVWMDRRRKGEYIPAYLTEQQLAWYRRRLRMLCLNNEIALAVINNRTHYAIGSGFRYRVVPRRPGLAPGLTAQCQDLLDAFAEFNHLPRREVETLVRMDIDGEAFLRLFETDAGLLAVRFVEPEFVRSPSGDDRAERSFGVETLKYDVETVQGYWIVQGLPDEGAMPEFVPASEVVHLKALETPASSKRGLSPFCAIETNLRLAEELLTSTVALAKSRAKIAMLRKLSGAVADVASALVQSQASFQAQDPQSSETVNIEKFGYGTILTVPESMGVEFPAANIAASDHVTVYQMVLRTIGARFSMPEYMISGDASNANYASTLVAESPFVKAMSQLQDHLGRLLGRNRYGDATRSILWRQLAYSAKQGILPRNILQLVDIQVEGPTLTVRDPSKDAQVDQVYHGLGVKSRTTIQLEQGLDPETEQKHFRKEQSQQPQPLEPGARPAPGASPAPAAAAPDAVEDMGDLFAEACVANQSGTGHHDDKTGYPCKPDGAAEKPSPGKHSEDAETPTQPARSKLIASLLSSVGGLAAGVQAAVSSLGKGIWGRMPEKQQQRAAKLFAIGKAVEHKAMIAFHKGKALASQVARERGLSDAQAERAGKIIGIVDQALAWTTTFPAVTAVTGNPLAGKVASFVPMASTAYLAYSTARNPLAMIRAARKVFGASSHVPAMAEALYEATASPDVVAALLHALEQAADPEWMQALLSAALDANGYDLGQAIQQAQHAARKMPAPENGSGVAEACVPNEKGSRYHDDQSGKPCSPDGPTKQGEPRGKTSSPGQGKAVPGTGAATKPTASRASNANDKEQSPTHATGGLRRASHAAKSRISGYDESTSEQAFASGFGTHSPPVRGKYPPEDGVFEVNGQAMGFTEVKTQTLPGNTEGARIKSDQAPAKLQLQLRELKRTGDVKPFVLVNPLGADMAEDGVLTVRYALWPPDPGAALEWKEHRVSGVQTMQDLTTERLAELHQAIAKEMQAYRKELSPQQFRERCEATLLSVRNKTYDAMDEDPDSVKGQGILRLGAKIQDEKVKAQAGIELLSDSLPPELLAQIQKHLQGGK